MPESKSVEIIDNCVLEWQKYRGELYVWSKDARHVLLRIIGLDPKFEVSLKEDGEIRIGLNYDRTITVTFPEKQISEKLGELKKSLFKGFK